MPRPPLPIGAWGKISRAQVEPGKWVARARFRDVDGVTRKVEAWGRTGAAAERSLVIAMKERAERSNTDFTPESRLGALAEFWYRTKVENSKLSANTQVKYRDTVERHIVPGVGGLLLREVNVARMSNFIELKAKDPGPATAKVCKTVLSNILALAAQNNAIATNPMRDVAAVDASEKAAPVRALTANEIQKLRAAIAGDKVALRWQMDALVDLMLVTGARIGEVLAIRWEDLDLNEKTLTLCGTVVRDKDRGLLRQGHTKGKRDRVVWLPDVVVTKMERLRTNGLPAGDLNLVFPNASGGLREVSTMEKAWRAFRKRHPGWEWVTFHSFRKTVATTLERAVGVKDAASQLGHTSELVTKRHYVEQSTMAPDHTALLEQLLA